MKKINWGIIGCGDVTEIKSGPAFNKVQNSALVAVMRRDAEKAKDYARRHNVPKWYSHAQQLIDDPEINAIYVATPPSSHEEYTLAALRAGKPVYVEKPMAVNWAAAKNMTELAREKKIKVVVAHYRRGQPFFQKIKQILEEKWIGELRFANLNLYKKSLSNDEMSIPKTAWRIDPAIAGGGLFHDLAPHQLDLACYFFGKPVRATGLSTNQARRYPADDVVAGNILFENGVLFHGIWNFNIAETDEKESFEITGSKGKIEFSVFGEPMIRTIIREKTETILFDPLPHVQQPMIQKVVDYFLDEGPNPCSAEEGVEVMALMEKFTKSR
jgi:predicted dehydrogenase